MIRSERFLLLGVLAVAAAWASFVIGRFSPEPAGADASGYFNSAALLSKGKLTTGLRVPAQLRWHYPYDIEPLGFHFDNSRAVLVPTYFVGLPLLLAGAHLLVGWNAASFVVVLGSSVLLLAASYLMLRQVNVYPPLAMAAVAGLAWSPIFVFASTQTYSDSAASLGCALAALCLLKPSKGNLALAVLSGASLGFVLLVRSTDCLLLPALLILAPTWRHRGAVVAGCAPFVAALIGYQHLAYGSAFVSGYGSVSRMFAWRYAAGSLANYATVLPRLLPVAVLAPFGFFFAKDRLPLRVLLGLGTWIGAFGIFYAFYLFTGQDWTFLRFIEPIFPAILVLGCIAAEAIALRLAPTLPRAGTLSAAAWTLLVVCGCFALTSHFANPKLHDRGFVAARSWMRGNLPPDSLVICYLFSGSVYFDTPNPVLRWDETSKENIVKYSRDMWNSGKTVYSVVDASELADPQFQAKVSGRWEKLADFGTASAWRVDPYAAAGTSRK